MVKGITKINKQTRSIVENSMTVSKAGRASLCVLMAACIRDKLSMIFLMELGSLNMRIKINMLANLIKVSGRARASTSIARAPHLVERGRMIKKSKAS
jgi:hypothetical protein